MSSVANESTQVIENFKEQLDGFNDSANEMKVDAVNLENSLMITLVKIDHILFKSDAFNRTIKNLGSDGMTLHTNCRLGKWYKETGKERFGSTQSYKKLDKSHEQIHTLSIEASNISKNGYDDKNSKTLIDKFTIIEESSTELFIILDTMKQEYQDKIKYSQ